MRPSVYTYIAVMAVVTYLIRLLPLTLIRREIKNKFIRSFLYYVPFVTLSVMVFPAILTASSGKCASAAGFVTALILAYCRKSLITVALCASAVVFLVELLPLA